MEKRKLLLLKFLLNNCSDGYKVLDTNKVLSQLNKYKGNYELFEKDIEYLKRMNYIDLKYIDKLSLCLCIKDNSRILQENLKVESGTKKQFIIMIIISMIISGIMSFVGAYLALLILG